MAITQLYHSYDSCSCNTVVNTIVNIAIHSGFPHSPSIKVVNVNYFQLESQIFKVGSRKRLSQNACYLESCWSVY